MRKATIKWVGTAAAAMMLSTMAVGCGSSGGAKPASSGGAGSGGSSTKPIVMKIGHTLSLQSHYEKTAEYFADLVNKGTDGKVQVKTYPQSQLGGEVQMTEALRTGTQDMEITAQAPVVDTDKSFEVLSLPYLFDNIDQGNKVLQGPVGKEFLDQLSKYNMKGLAWMSVLERDVFARKPITDLNSMKGMKIRVMQDPGYVNAYKALGANPTPMAYNELYMALQQGTVDGGDTSPDQMIQDKFFEVAKNFAITKVNYLPVAIVISDTTWNKLTPDEQKVVQDAANQAAQFDLKTYKQSYDDSIKELQQKGVKVTQVDTAAWKQAVQPFVQQEVKQIPDGPKLYQDILNAEK